MGRVIHQAWRQATTTRRPLRDLLVTAAQPCSPVRRCFLQLPSVAPGQDARPARAALRVGGEGIMEEHALLGEAVKLRRLDPVFAFRHPGAARRAPRCGTSGTPVRHVGHPGAARRTPRCGTSGTPVRHVGHSDAAGSLAQGQAGGGHPAPGGRGVPQGALAPGGQGWRA